MERTNVKETNPIEKNVNIVHVLLRFLTIVLAGLAGLVLLFGDNDSYLILILSKPAGVLLLILSYACHGSLRKMYGMFGKGH